MVILSYIILVLAKNSSYDLAYSILESVTKIHSGG